MESHLCLSDLLDQDLSSYEFFHGLPAPVQAKLLKQEISSFEELQHAAAQARKTENIR